jgi:hypothetical protein
MFDKFYNLTERPFSAYRSPVSGGAVNVPFRIAPVRG